MSTDSVRPECHQSAHGFGEAVSAQPALALQELCRFRFFPGECGVAELTYTGHCPRLGRFWIRLGCRAGAGSQKPVWVEAAIARPPKARARRVRAWAGSATINWGMEMPPATSAVAQRRPGQTSKVPAGAGMTPTDISEPAVLPQGGRLPVRLSHPYAGARIHPPDRAGPLCRGLHAQLGIERLPGHSRPHLRSPLRAGLPARPHRGKARRHLPLEARRRRPQGRHRRPDAARSTKNKNGRRVGLIGAGPASLAVARDLI